MILTTRTADKGESRRKEGESLPIAVDDRVQAMGDGQHRALRELLADHALDESVRLVVDGGCGFVQHQDLGLAQDGSSNADQLS
jgi:hypothetical protein